MTVKVTTTTTPTGGTSNGEKYTYDAIPTLTKVTPAAGKVAGGTTVTLTGTGFVDRGNGLLRRHAGTTVTVVSTTEITVKTPAHAAGTVTVTVTTPGGTTGTQKYTYDAAPTLTKVTPPAGKMAGGTTVTLTGTGFVDRGHGLVRRHGGTTVTVVSPTEITVKTPAHAAGTVTVTVTTPGGTSGGVATTTSGPPPSPRSHPAPGRSTAGQR